MTVGLLVSISFPVIAYSLHSLLFPTSRPPLWVLCHHTELSRDRKWGIANLLCPPAVPLSTQWDHQSNGDHSGNL